MKLKYSMMVIMISTLANSAGYAGSNRPDSLGINNDAVAASLYWTPERLKNAKPIEAYVDPNAIVKETTDTQGRNTVNTGEDGHSPTVAVEADLHPLFTPITLSPSSASLNSGGRNEQFSSSRLVPLSADVSYPYRAVGKFYFTKPNGDFVCSASVIKPRVILTAGHCVHSGSGGAAGYYRNFLFIPAFRDGSMPYGSWAPTFVNVTTTWATGGGSFPNAADYAMLEMQDSSINGVLTKIGNVTGWLGWQTQSLIPNHVHQLGYPCNFDNCAKMHQVATQSAVSVSPNNVEYGSDMGGGSSGGPWVQNFGQAATGQTGGRNPGMNRVVGVTSWGYNDTSLMALGAANFDSRFTSLLDTMCAHKAGNC